MVLMSKDPSAPLKLIDFGAAVVLDESEQVIAGGKVGTWTYWAPEQADKDKPYDQASLACRTRLLVTSCRATQTLSRLLATPCRAVQTLSRLLATSCRAVQTPSRPNP